MISRHFAAFAAAGIGLALFAAPAAAQYYSPRPYYPAPGAYGAPAPSDDDDITAAEDDDDMQAPGAPPQGARTDYPGLQQGGYPYDSRVQSAPLPDRSVPGGQPGYAPPAGQQAVPGGYMTPPNSYGRAPGNGAYNAPADGNYSPRPDYDQAPRPPAVIESNRAPNSAAGAVPAAPSNIASLPPDDQPEVGEPKELPPQFKRQTVDYLTKEPVGTIIIDTPSTYLYYVLGNGKAIRYGIGVGRDGFTWSGKERITRMAEWPDWYPPSEMIERQPYLPRMMAGGPGNPLGARALYLGKTVYRIHGTNQPSTIGKFVSSGCIRMLNEDVEDLYGRVKVGTKVVVLPSATPSASVASPVAGAATATR